MKRQEPHFVGTRSKVFAETSLPTKKGIGCQQQLDAWRNAHTEAGMREPSELQLLSAIRGLRLDLVQSVLARTPSAPAYVIEEVTLLGAALGVYPWAPLNWRQADRPITAVCRSKPANVSRQERNRLRNSILIELARANVSPTFREQWALLRTRGVRWPWWEMPIESFDAFTQDYA